jgi:hypothetical protein
MSKETEVSVAVETEVVGVSVFVVTIGLSPTNAATIGLSPSFTV